MRMILVCNTPWLLAFEVRLLKLYKAYYEATRLGFRGCWSENAATVPSVPVHRPNREGWNEKEENNQVKTCRQNTALMHIVYTSLSLKLNQLVL